MTADGATGTTYQVSSGAQGDKLPRLDLEGEGGAMVIWHFRVNFDTDNLHGRRLGGDGQPLGSQFTILEMADSRQMHPALAGNGNGQYFLTWQDDRNGNWDICAQRFQQLQAAFTATPSSGDPPLEVQFTDTSTPADIADQWLWSFGDGGTSTLQHPVYTYTQSGSYMVTLAITDTDSGESDILAQPDAVQVGEALSQTAVIQYEYDALYRLRAATYTGDISATYAYEYDAIGNRLAYTTSLTSTSVITYQYDAANRLILSQEDGITATTYTWDNMSRLINDYGWWSGRASLWL